MDHHCPWVLNTIGAHNHKFFYLTLLWGSFDLWLIAFTLWESVGGAVLWAWDADPEFGCSAYRRGSRRAVAGAKASEVESAASTGLCLTL